MTNSVCKVAVVGAGNMAREHIRAFAAVPGAIVVGIQSRTRARAEKLAAEHGIAAVYDSVSDLYRRTQADLVAVTVPELATNAVATACFEFPWTVFLEKPPGYNLQDAEQIQAAASARGRTVLVALNRRFCSSTRAALADVAQSDGPRFIRVQDQEDPEAAAAHGQPAEVVRNWMYANSIHIVDYFQIFARSEVKAVTPVVSWRSGASPVVVARVEYECGDLGLYEGIWQGPGPWAVTITTPRKCWELRPLEQLAVQVRGERRWHPVEGHPWDREFKPGFRLQAEMAVAAALGKPSQAPTLHDVMKTMRLIASIFEN